MARVGRSGAARRAGTAPKRCAVAAGGGAALAGGGAGVGAGGGGGQEEEDSARARGSVCERTCRRHAFPRLLDVGGGDSAMTDVVTLSRREALCV